ncbi:MAG: hypothetical protein JST17_02235 [Bacteroidetes bacterium]|nr:hypothetical protein [Bacteroidota bacterium]MBS1931354.1 hypothetical protein [Bacteroidota bacterium]
MKNSGTAVLCLCFVMSAFITRGQNQKIPLNEPDYNKPRVFQNLPDSILLDAATVSDLFNLSKGQTITPESFNRSGTAVFQLRGEVVSKSENTPSNILARSAGVAAISSLILKLTEYNGANFTISKIKNPDGTVRYTGRIINFKSGDLFVLQNNNGKLMLVKKDYYALVNE